MIVTLDGPAGSGKSTVAKKVAAELGIEFLNTGAMYRVITLAMLREKISLDDNAGIERVLSSVHIRFQNNRVFSNEEDVSLAIRTPEIDRNVSPVSALSPVRQTMTKLQRELALHGSIVCEGRDMGSVVFPNAEFKFYLEASPEVRARRRMLEMREKGDTSLSYETVLEDIKRRDAYDKSRPIAPLVVPEGAIVIDTSEMSVEAVTEEVLRKVCSK